MRLIDTHTHLDFPDFDADRPRLLANAASRGVERMVVLGVYQANFQRVWDLACADQRLFAALGLHPIYLDQHRPEHLTQLREWLERLHASGWRQATWFERCGSVSWAKRRRRSG